MDAPVFLPIEIVNPARAEAARSILPSNVLPDCLLEIELAGGHRLRISGSYDPEALARLICGRSSIGGAALSISGIVGMPSNVPSSRSAMRPMASYSDMQIARAKERESVRSSVYW